MSRDYHHLAAASPEDTDKELAQTYTQIVSSLDTHIAALQRERDAVQQDAERSLLHGATETTSLQRGSVGGGRNRTALPLPISLVQRWECPRGRAKPGAAQR